LIKGFQHRKALATSAPAMMLRLIFQAIPKLASAAT
jgi:hypothetical protein